MKKYKKQPQIEKTFREEFIFKCIRLLIIYFPNEEKHQYIYFKRVFYNIYIYLRNLYERVIITRSNNRHLNIDFELNIN